MDVVVPAVAEVPVAASGCLPPARREQIAAT